MGTTPDLYDILAMLGLFVTGFAMWVAWELITGRKLLALLLALGSFAATWSVIGLVVRPSPLILLAGEVVIAALLVRVARAKA